MKFRDYIDFMSPKLPRLYCLTSDNLNISHAEQVSVLCEAGVRLIQIRSKKLSQKELLTEAIQSVEICFKYDAKLIINDSLEVVQRSGADGVHLGQKDVNPRIARESLGDSKLVGITIHSKEQIDEDIHQIADYIGMGPFRNSVTKADLKANLSEEDYLYLINRTSPIPVFLIGGLDLHDFSLSRKLGNHGLAICSGLSKGSFLDNSRIREFIRKSNQQNEMAVFQ